MEFIVVILAGCVLAIPVIAIVALVRTGRLRDSLDERFSDQMDRIRDLEAQVSSLRRDLNQMQSVKVSGASAVAPEAASSRVLLSSEETACMGDASLRLNWIPSIEIIDCVKRTSAVSLLERNSARSESERRVCSP